MVLFLNVAVGYLALSQYVLVLNDPVHLGAGVASAELGGDLARGYPLGPALWWTAGNCIEPLVGAVLLRRLGNPSGRLVPVHQLLRFLVAAVVVGPLVGASIGSIGTVALGDMEMLRVWPK